MKLYLDVPFEEKDAAKKAGAFWHASKRRWFIVDRAVGPFLKWLAKDYESQLAMIEYERDLEAELRRIQRLQERLKNKAKPIQTTLFDPPAEGVDCAFNKATGESDLSSKSSVLLPEPEGKGERF